MAIKGITIHELLNQLRCNHGPSSTGDYKCHCPAHDDRTESLTVSEGEKGIVLRCHAGCSIDRICGALGIKVADLFWQDARGEKRARQKPTPQSPTKQPPKLYGSIQEAFGYLGEVVCSYPYTDEAGKLIFEVVRIRTGSGKTFRQCRPADPDKGHYPIVCSVPESIRRGLIYRLKDVKAAIAAGATVYVVEGEKDADTLRSWGRCATTCPGGAEGWREEHSQQLAGADVVLVPDNDKAGEAHEAQVVALTRDVAKRMRVVHLRDGYPALKDKGDITDLAEAVGADKAMEILDALTENAAEAEEDMYQVAIRAWNALPGYCVSNGCISQRVEDGAKTLATFVALPTAEITRDDGAVEQKLLEIMGWDANGKPLKTLTVDIGKYKSLDWAMEEWGMIGNVMPGNTVRDRLRSAIIAAGVNGARKVTVYQHMGWRRIDGRWCYLHRDGCIGAEDVTVDMGAGLEDYTLDAPDDIDLVDAAVTSGSLAEFPDSKVSVPMLGVTYLAPLSEFLQQSGNPPSFVTMIKGYTGSGKSVMAQLFLSHFGDFIGEGKLPANFGDTSNYVRMKAFYAKDAMLVVDDYHPTTSREERRQMQRTAQQLSRAFGNRQERGRLNADMSVQVSRPPRALAVITGELLPDIGSSGIGRFYVIEMDKIPMSKVSDTLTDLQQRAMAGELRMAMRGYIEWLLPQTDKLAGRLGAMFLDYRRRASQALADEDAHTRTPSTVAHIMIGLTMMLDYFESLGLYDEDGKREKLDEYWQIVTGNSTHQAEETREDEPVQMFMSAVTEMLASKTIAVSNIIPTAPPSTPKNMVGYADEINYYLMADTVFGAVVKFFGDQERLFPVNRAELFRQLRAQGVVEQIGSDGKTTRAKRTPDGKNQRLLWIPRWKIDGGRPPEPPATQEKMDFEEVSGDDLPEGWRAEE